MGQIGASWSYYNDNNVGYVLVIFLFGFRRGVPEKDNA